jgi:hypothetical protein
MRELNEKEIMNVSGAGFFSDLGKSIGAAIGGIVDKGTAVGGLNTNATTAGETLGFGIGSLLDLDFVNAVSGIGNGVASIVAFGIDAINQIKANKVAA